MPISAFRKEWDKLNQYEMLQAWKTAKFHAAKTLTRQIKKTGVAILGKADPTLLEDPKFLSADFVKHSVLIGEELAHTLHLLVKCLYCD